MDRRNFVKIVSASGVAIAASPVVNAAQSAKTLLPTQKPEAPAIPATNLEDALKVPRKKDSMPGKYPGKVIVCKNENSVVDGTPAEDVAYQMVASSLLALTGKKSLKRAWRKFVTPKEVIGLKVNPIGGKLLSTSHAVTKAVIKQLEEAGIPRKNIVIWDRRQEDLNSAGFTAENYPDIKILSTEYVDENGSFYDSEGKLYGESRIDKDCYFYADVEMEYDSYTMPYMINSGKYSYFSKIVTQQVDKIINIPILKNAGASVTCCMKNLAFGSISNTSRLHQKLWHQTCAYICAFPPIRDKVVLNIVDGLRGCFEGGPGANPQYICEYKTILAGSDPVAVDRAAHDIVIAKRIEEGVQKKDSERGYIYATLAEELGLGSAHPEIVNI